MPDAPDQPLMRLGQPSRLTRVVIVLAVLASIRYFGWRFTATMNPAAVWFFYAFLAAELIGFGEGLLFYLTTWRQGRRRPPPAAPGQTVDVFIPTSDEPLSLLRDTALCAVSLTYPHTTWILDDGNRPEAARLAGELGCQYLARSDRGHARAGNLNHALARSGGAFIVTLDADHVPMPDLIEQLLGFFEDPKVAVVQAHQDFYNLDSFQHDTDWEDRAAWQQQELFFSVIQPGKDAFDAAMYCGSPAMLRRAALEDVNGFATETVTEDTHTGLRLQKRGWRVVYHNRTVARGLAPQTYEAYTTQWHRWGLGAMQVLRAENPLFGKGLTLGQRLCYLASFYFGWASFQKLFYLLVPILCIGAAVFPLLTQPQTYLQFFLPHLALNVAATSALQGGWRGFVLTERYNLIKLGSMMRSVAGFFRRRAPLAGTPPASGEAASAWHVLPYLVLEVLLGVAIVGGVVRIVSARTMFEFWAYGANVLFALFFLYLMVPVVVLALRRREHRAAYRFPQRLDLPTRYRLVGARASAWAEAYARNLNRFGLSITLDVALPKETELELVVQLPEREVHAVGTVRWTKRFTAGTGARFANGLRFDRIATEDQDAIARHLFWEIAPRHGELLTMTHQAQRAAAEA